MCLCVWMPKEPRRRCQILELARQVVLSHSMRIREMELRAFARAADTLTWANYSS